MFTGLVSGNDALHFLGFDSSVPNPTLDMAGKIYVDSEPVVFEVQRLTHDLSHSAQLSVPCLNVSALAWTPMVVSMHRPPVSHML